VNRNPTVKRAQPKYPTSLNGGESQDPDDVRVGETHVKAPEGFERSEVQRKPADDGNPDSGFDSDDAAPSDHAR